MIEWSKDPKAVGDVTLDEPHRSPPLVVDLQQGTMTPAAGAEPVGAVGELRLVVRLQDQAEHFLQQLVRPGRQSQRTLLARSLLLDVAAPHRSPPVALLTEHADDRLDLAEVHAVHSLAGDPRGHRARIPVDLAVSEQVQVRVEQASVDPFQRQTPPAAITNDL
jgi:hypothetical protein